MKNRIKTKIYAKLLLSVFVLIYTVASLTSCFGLSLLFFGAAMDNANRQNDNRFIFAGYDTIEITVSGSEKIILQYLPEYSDLSANTSNIRFGGRGERIKDGEAIPIVFKETSEMNLLGAQIRGFDIKYDSSRFEELGRYAHIANETYKSNYYPDGYYHVKFTNDAGNYSIKNVNEDGSYGDSVGVSCTTYKRSSNEKWAYVDNDYINFSPASSDALYSSEDGLFYYNSETGEGSWAIGDISLPVRVEFDEDECVIAIADAGNGQVYFYGSGYLTGENTAVFDKYITTGYYTMFQGNFSIIKLPLSAEQ